MKRQMRTRLATATLALAIAAGSGAPAVGAQTGGSGARGPTTEPFIPFVTDFGRSPSPTPSEVGSPAGPATAAAESGRRWEDLALGAAVGLGFATLVGGGLAAARSRRPAAALRHETGA